MVLVLQEEFPLDTSFALQVRVSLAGEAQGSHEESGQHANKIIVPAAPDDSAIKINRSREVQSRYLASEIERLLTADHVDPRLWTLALLVA